MTLSPALKRAQLYIAGPFLFQDKISVPLVAIFVVINSIVLFNAVSHNPGAGYDAYSHLKYIRRLTIRLPIKGDTSEYFSPPLPYFVPSLAFRACYSYSLEDIFGPSGLDPCLHTAGKVAQMQNVLTSICLTFYLVKLAELIRPDAISFRILSLALLGMLPVYYKTFAFVRGEPLVALFAVLATYQVLVMMFTREKCSLVRSVSLGLTLGLALLSRQWAFMLFPPVLLMALVLLVKRTKNAVPFIEAIGAAFAIAFVVGGWFYLLQLTAYGTPAAFNRSAATTLSFSSQPSSFYFGTGDGQVFTNPVRPAFPNQLLPVFYSEIWGDYWSYFVVTKSNLSDMASYLGRVNAVSVVPTLILVAGLTMGAFYLIQTLARREDDGYRRIAMFSLLELVILGSFAGYFLFLLRYPSLQDGDTIKATYMLHALVLAAPMSAEFLRALARRYRRAYYVAVVLLGVSFLHNLPVLFTRFPAH